MQNLEEWQAELVVIDSWDELLKEWQEKCNIDLDAFLNDFLEHTHIKFTEI